MEWSNGEFCQKCMYNIGLFYKIYDLDIELFLNSTI